MKLVLRLCLAAAFFGINAAECQAAVRAAVLFDTERRAAAEHLCGLFPKGACELVAVQNLADPGRLSGLEVVIGAPAGLPEKALAAMGDYVQGGGLLVVGGDFLRYIDVDRDGAYNSQIDRRGAAEAVRLTGCTRDSFGVVAARLRVLNWTPPLRDWKIDEWIDADHQLPAGMLRLSDGAAPLVEGEFCDPEFFKTPESFFYDYHGSRFRAGYRASVAAFQSGRGVVVSIAQDFMSAPLSPVMQSLLRDVCNRAAWLAFQARALEYGDVEPSYKDGNLVPNGDFETLCRTRISNPIPKNNLRGEILMPAGWWFNSWNGEFQARVVPEPDGGHAAVIQTVKAHSGGANWVVWLDQLQLRPGAVYRLALRARATPSCAAGAYLSITLADDTRKSIEVELADGNGAWAMAEQTFTLPAICPAPKRVRRGVRLGLRMSGIGEARFDDVSLMRVEAGINGEER